MICINMKYLHTPIANKSWKRRREREILRIVTGAVSYAFVGRDFPTTEVQFNCREHFALTSIRVFVEGIDEERAKRVVNYLNNNRNVYANHLTQPELSVTM